MHGGKEKYFLDIWKQEVPDCKFSGLYVEKKDGKTGKNRS